MVKSMSCLKGLVTLAFFMLLSLQFVEFRGIFSTCGEDIDIIKGVALNSNLKNEMLLLRLRIRSLT